MWNLNVFAILWRALYAITGDLANIVFVNKFYCNTITFFYACLDCFLPTMTRLSSCNRNCLRTEKPKILTIWSFTEKILWTLVISNGIFKLYLRTIIAFRFRLLYSTIDLDVNGCFGYQQFLSLLINASCQFLIYIF